MSNTGIKYGLIAAGQGSRLLAEGIKVPKPLVKVNGEELIGRLLRVFQENDAESICIIINEEMPAVRAYLESYRLSVPLHLVVKSTPDSFHSFCELMPYLREGGGKFCLTTVDPVFREAEFKEYIRFFVQDDEDDALMGVTDYIDDEKPLFVMTEPDTLKVTGYVDKAYDGYRYISGGVYCMNQKALALLPKAMQEGVSRMRGFQRYLVESGLRVKAWPFGKIIDIDHAEDISKAERFMKGL